MIIRPEGSDVGVWVDDPPLSAAELDELDRQRAEVTEAREAALKPLLKEDFLNTLVQASRTYGRTGDFIEIAYFINWCFGIADKALPKDYDTPY